MSAWNHRFCEIDLKRCAGRKTKRDAKTATPRRAIWDADGFETVPRKPHIIKCEVFVFIRGYRTPLTPYLDKTGVVKGIPRKRPSVLQDPYHAMSHWKTKRYPHVDGTSSKTR